MAKNLDHVLTDFNGDPIPETAGGKPATVRFVVVNALLSDLAGENPSGDEKAQRYALALRIHEGGNQEFTPEELTLVKSLVGKAYGPLIVGRVFDWAKI